MKVKLVKARDSGCWYSNLKLPIDLNVIVHKQMPYIYNIQDSIHNGKMVYIDDCINDEELKPSWLEPLNKPFIIDNSFKDKPTKETEGKLFYELDWEFIEGMAQRMALNKGKYDAFGWKKGVDIEQLKQALTRHLIEIHKGNISDEQLYGHYYALALNSMLSIHEVKRNL